MSRIIKLLVLSTVFILALSACGASGDMAAQAVQDYYQAIVDGDAERAVALACADWELNAQMDVDSFQAVDASLDDFTCEQTGTNGDMATVDCQGKIVMSYVGEDQFLDLTAFYQAQIVGGDWLFCGYSQ